MANEEEGNVEQGNVEQSKPLSESQWKYINSLYNYARGIGINILKGFLLVVIVFVGLPTIFYKEMSMFFRGANPIFLFISWAGVIISVGLGFVTFFYIFEAYFNFAHSENFRMLDNREHMANFHKISNTHFERARVFGFSCLIAFIVSLLSLILFIASALF